MDTAEQQGRTAYSLGDQQHHNPYHLESMVAKDWLNGWWDAWSEARGRKPNEVAMPPGTTPTGGFTPWDEVPKMGHVERPEVTEALARAKAEAEAAKEQEANDHEKMLAMHRDEELQCCETAVRLFAIHYAGLVKKASTVSALMKSVNLVLDAFGIRAEERWSWFGQAMTDYLTDEARQMRKPL